MIRVVGLPHIESRYTGDWSKMLHKYMLYYHKGEPITYYSTAESYDILPTEFLDYGIYYKFIFDLLKVVVDEVEDNDTIFFFDGETAGVEAFEYIRKMSKMNLKIKTFWHAGTYDEYDLTAIRGVRGKNFELGWFDISDKIYVSSQFHKDLIVEKRDVDKDKVIVTGNPLDLSRFEDGSKVEKSYDIMFAGRLVPEKGYDIVKELREKGINITSSMEHKWSKRTFYFNLARSKVLFSPSKQDMFATACMEALASNVPVLVPNTKNYESIIPERYRYNNLEDIDWSNVSKLATGYERKIVTKYSYEKVMGEWFK